MLRSYATFLTLTTGWCYINAIRFYCFLILEFVFPCDGNPFDKSLHGCFSETVLSGVGSLGVVGVHPRIEVCLQLLNRGIDFLSKCDCIELVLHGSVESLADAVCLRAFRLDFRVVYILHSQIQFIFVVFSVSAVSVPLSVSIRISFRSCCSKKGTILSLSISAATRAFFLSYSLANPILE